MQKLSVIIFIVLLIILGYSSCKTKQDELVLKGDEYFPIKIGTVKFYQIDTIIYDNFNSSVDTISNKYREEIVQKLVNGSGDSFYRVELSLFNNKRNLWEAQKSISRNISGNYAIENIDNKPEIKLLFPISQYKTKGSSFIWNLNLLSNDDITNVKYTSVFKSFNNTLAIYNDCVSVGLQLPEKGIVNNIREEVYAKGIGLVYRHIDQTDYLVLNSRNGIEVYVRLIP